MHQNYLEGLLKHRSLGSTTEFCDSISLEWVWRVCISNMFLGDVDASGPKTTVEEPLLGHNFNKFSYLVVQSRLAGTIRRGVVRGIILIAARSSI